MVQNIRVAQEGYHSETQQYANFSTVLDRRTARPLPTRDLSRPGVAACTVCANLPGRPSGPRRRARACSDTRRSPALPARGRNRHDPRQRRRLVNPGAPPTTDWYRVAAEGDLDSIPDRAKHTDVCLSRGATRSGSTTRDNNESFTQENQERKS